MDNGKNITQYLAETQARVIDLRDQIYKHAGQEDDAVVTKLRYELKQAEENWHQVAIQAELQNYDPSEYSIEEIYSRPAPISIDTLLKQSREDVNDRSGYIASFIAPERIHFSDKLRSLGDRYEDVWLDLEEHEIPKLVRFQGQILQIDLCLRGPVKQVEGWRAQIRSLLEKNRRVEQVI